MVYGETYVCSSVIQSLVTPNGHMDPVFEVVIGDLYQHGLVIVYFIITQINKPLQECLVPKTHTQVHFPKRLGPCIKDIYCG